MKGIWVIILWEEKNMKRKTRNFLKGNKKKYKGKAEVTMLK
jgi:hypothetical protein